ncbi:hypothetical protein T4E_4682 [Trichinella pseudospiralis]|uniref:Uncharacterized protein n=1 Tax=Trichinella pseudospiralis TaxID=6337 RepID=A0A0V0XSA8_TRIPS|nr:hypothetical protein T4E_4682 [Trichinella pseudospiralis]
MDTSDLAFTQEDNQNGLILSALFSVIVNEVQFQSRSDGHWNRLNEEIYMELLIARKTHLRSESGDSCMVRRANLTKDPLHYFTLIT